jgi:solute carrier family 25 (mitochondrial oxoglutarate transporter), member 11
MNQRPDHLTGEYPYKGVLDASMKIFQQEGAVGFFRGFSAYYGRCAPHAMIILLSIETITSLYQKTMY